MPSSAACAGTDTVVVVAASSAEVSFWAASTLVSLSASTVTSSTFSKLMAFAIFTFRVVCVRLAVLAAMVTLLSMLSMSVAVNFRLYSPVSFTVSMYTPCASVVAVRLFPASTWAPVNAPPVAVTVPTM